MKSTMRRQAYRWWRGWHGRVYYELRYGPGFPSWIDAAVAGVARPPTRRMRAVLEYVAREMMKPRTWADDYGVPTLFMHEQWWKRV